MRLLIRIFLLLFLFFLLRYLLRSIFVSPKSNSSGTSEPAPPGAGSREIHQGRMERDPICGTYVDVASSLKIGKSGGNYYFCSEECLKQFQRKEN